MQKLVWEQWTVLLEKTKPAQALQDKFSEENDLDRFFKKVWGELAAIKAVISPKLRKRFLCRCRPKIPFLKVHIFWRQLKEKRIDQAPLLNPATRSFVSMHGPKLIICGTKDIEIRKKRMASLFLETIPRNKKEAALPQASGKLSDNWVFTL